MRRRFQTSIILVLGLFGFAGCNAYRLDPPAGFAEVRSGTRSAHLKAGDDAGLGVRVYDNVRGGTLAFWSEDLVRKLGERGYQLVGQKPVRSKNGRNGTQFDFAYVPAEGEEKFYSAALFVTDKYRVVIQIAGDDVLAQKYRPQMEQIAGSAKIRGCRSWSDLCEGPQPGRLQTPDPKPAQTENLASDAAEESPDGAG